MGRGVGKCWGRCGKVCWGEETWEGEEKGVGKRWGGVGGLGEVRGVEKCGGDVEKCVGGMGEVRRCGKRR